MADVPQDLSTILTALAQNIRPRIVRGYNRRSTLLRTIQKVKGEGKNVGWDWEGDAQIAETFADGADATNFGSDTQNFASLSWALYRANFRVTDVARAAARSSRTPEALLRLWARNMSSAMSKIASSINVAGFSGTGGLAIAGLDTALDDTNTYAGVDRSLAPNAGFRASVFDPGSPTAPTIQQGRDDIAAVLDASGESPDLAICKTSVYNKIAGAFDESRRRVDEIRTAAGTIKLDGSIGGMEIDGCVYLKDKDATANKIYYLNTEYLRWEYLPQDDSIDQPGTTMETSDDGYGAIPLGMKVKHLATQGASERASAQVFLNLVVEHPLAMGVRKNVSVT